MRFSSIRSVGAPLLLAALALLDLPSAHAKTAEDGRLGASLPAPAFPAPAIPAPAVPAPALPDGPRPPSAVPPAPSPGFSALAAAASQTPNQSSFTSSSVPTAPNVGGEAIRPVDRPLSRAQISSGCSSGELHGKTCKVSWGPVLWQSFEWLTVQHAGNILLDSETRHDLTVNPYWSTYVQDVKNYRWDQWSDDTTFIVHDIGHPMMGGITSSIYEQNDPKGRALVYENSSVYWHSRLKAMAWSAVYSAQWKVGPVSEASIGNSGRNTYYVPNLHRTTNETGFQDFIITPVYGMGWNVGEDVIDRYLMPKIRARVHSKLGLSALFWMTPCKSAANVLRFKPMYYRDEMAPMPR